MNILLIILSLIGLLKLVSLFILATIQIYYNYKYKQSIEFGRTFSWFKISTFYIIPTIYFELDDKSFYIRFVWLNFEYYEDSKINII